MNSDTKRFHTIEDVTETKAMPVENTAVMPVADTETIAPVTGPAAETMPDSVPETKVMPVAESDATAVLPVPEDAVATTAMPTVQDGVQDGTVTETLAPVPGGEEPRTIALESVADVVEEPVEPTAEDPSSESADESASDSLDESADDTPAHQPAETSDSDTGVDAPTRETVTSAVEPAADPMPEPKATSSDAQPDPKSMPVGELPLHGDAIPPATDVPMYGEPSAGRKPVAPEAKRGVSVLTIIFGVLGLIIGVTALAFGLVFPNTLIPTFAADPQLVVAIACGSIGVILVIVAIVWAVMGAAKQRKTQAGQ